MSRFTVLHIDDDSNDAFFVRRAFSKAKLDVALHHISDGQKALAYLAGEGSYADRDQYPLPSLVLLDIKIPVLDGFEILSWARRKEGLQDLPIYILSSSDQQQDRTRARELGADRFFVKTPGFQDVIERVKALVVNVENSNGNCGI